MPSSFLFLPLYLFLGQRFCFKTGSLAVSCMAADMVEKTEAVKGMKEKWEEIEKEAMAMGKEQSLNALNMSNMEDLMMIVTELDGHMEEMKGFMTMDSYIKGNSSGLYCPPLLLQVVIWRQP